MNHKWEPIWQSLPWFKWCPNCCRLTMREGEESKPCDAQEPKEKS
jgi:hypothetical protein